MTVAAGTPGSERKGARGTPLIVILGALVAFGPMAVDMYLPSLPTISLDLGATSASVQWTLAVFFIGFCLGMLIYGPLSDRLGRRPVLVVGIAIFVVASFACTVATDVYQLVLFRFVHALGGGAAAVLGRAIVRDLFPPDEAARVLSMMVIVMALAPLLAPTVGGQILVWFGWRTIFGVLAVFGVACLVAVLLWIPESHPVQKRAVIGYGAAFRAYGTIFTRRTAIGYMLCGGMAFAGMFAYITGTPFVYIEYFGVAPEHYGLLFGLNVVAMMIGAYINGRLVRRVGIQRMLVYGAAISAAAGIALAILGLSATGGLFGIVLPLLFFLGVIGLLGANCTARLMALFPDNAGAAVATFGAGQFGLGALASLAVSAMHDGTPFAMCVVIGVTGVGTLIARLVLAVENGGRT